MADKNHYVYQVSNPLTGEYYIGKRSCSCPIDQDPYMGSGKIIKHKVKSSRLKWNKVILSVCPSEEIAYAKERELIGDRWKTDPLCLNLCEGGRRVPLKRHIPNSKLEEIWVYHPPTRIRVKVTLLMAECLVEEGWTTSFRWGFSVRKTPFKCLIR